jgi:hypothetical protein
MYFNSADHSIIYTPDDLILFRESPFACWMERMTLENPRHGVSPDAGSGPPGTPVVSQAALALTFGVEGKKVAAIEWEGDEHQRRLATMEAMRSGVDFIVDGQLALDGWSAPVNLLLRASGASDFGDYCYLPCHTQGDESTDIELRLGFLADLLHRLQGRLPEQMLVIGAGGLVTPVETDACIHYVRALKQRCVRAMESFRIGAIPDPAESARFGRWSAYAGSILKQRAQAQTAGLKAGNSIEPGESSGTASVSSIANGARLAIVPRPEPDLTLAEQARQLGEDNGGREGRRGDERVYQPISAAEALSKLDVSGRYRSDWSTPDAGYDARTGVRERASDPVIGAEPDLLAALSPAVSARALGRSPKAHPLDSPGFSFDPLGEATDDPSVERVSLLSSEAQPAISKHPGDSRGVSQLPAGDRVGPGNVRPGDGIPPALPFNDSLNTSNSIFGPEADSDYDG